MKINKQQLHFLLVDYPAPEKKFGIFSSRSEIRRCFEKIRGDLSGPTRTANLDESEMTELMDALKSYISSQKLSDMSLIDHRMVHELMCGSLLSYELDAPGSDVFKEVVDEYFYALNKERHPTENEDNKKSSLDYWLQHFMDDPGCYITQLWIGGWGNNYFFHQLGLNECGCTDLSHDRLMNNVRLQAESNVIEQCKWLHSINPNSPIKILSLGPGKGLQEFILVLKLFNLGIRNIEFILVEPSYGKLLNIEEASVKIWKKDWQKNEPIPQNYYHSYQCDLYNIVRALSLLNKSYNDSNLSIALYDSVSNMKRDQAVNKNFLNIVYAIDFDVYDFDDKAKKDFDSLADCLSDNGIAILSHHHKLDQFAVQKQNNQALFIETNGEEFSPAKRSSLGSYEVINSIRSFCS